MPRFDYYKNYSINWKDAFRKQGITIIPNSESLYSLFSSVPFILPCTRCSNIKRNIKKEGGESFPKEFYRSKPNISFYKWCAHNELLSYGIISDLYGIVFWNEKIKYYDKAPNELNNRDFKILGRKIKDKVIKKGFTSLLFWYTSPILSYPYLKMILYSGLPLYYINTLRDFINVPNRIKPFF